MQREVRNRAGEGSLLNVLSSVARESKNFDKAVEYSEQALAIAREVKERSEEAGALTNLAVAEMERNNYARARGLLEETHRDLRVAALGDLQSGVEDLVLRVGPGSAAALQGPAHALARREPDARIRRAGARNDRTRACTRAARTSHGGGRLHSSGCRRVAARSRTRPGPGAQRESGGAGAAPQRIAHAGAGRRAAEDHQPDRERLRAGAGANPAHEPAVRRDHTASRADARRHPTSGPGSRHAAPRVLAGGRTELSVGGHDEFDIELRAAESRDYPGAGASAHRAADGPQRIAKGRERDQ